MSFVDDGSDLFGEDDHEMIDLDDEEGGAEEEQEQEIAQQGQQKFKEGDRVKHLRLRIEGVVTSTFRPRDNFIRMAWETLTPQGRGKRKRKENLNRWFAPDELQLIPTDDIPNSSLRLLCNAAEDACDPPALSQPLTGLPTLSQAHRSRRMKEKPPAKKRLDICGARKTRVVFMISPAKMLSLHFAEHPSLKPDPVKTNAVFCTACSSQYPNIKQALLQHVRSVKHLQHVVTMTEKAIGDSEVQGYLTKYYSTHSEENGACLPIDTQLYRYRVVESFLGTGIPISKAVGLRPLLERANIELTDRSHLSQFIPKVLDRELIRVREEIQGQKIGFTFDGTTRIGEAVNVVYRWCPADFSKIEHRLVNFTTMETHMSGKQLALFLNELLSNTMKVPNQDIVACSRDSYATNGAGLDVIKPLLCSLLDVKCYAHLLHGSADRFNAPELDEFMCHKWCRSRCDQTIALQPPGRKVLCAPSSWKCRSFQCARA